MNNFSCLLSFPTPYPTDGNNYYWNEDIINWELII